MISGIEDVDIPFFVIVLRTTFIYWSGFAIDIREAVAIFNWSKTAI